MWKGIYIYHATVFVLLSVCGIMWNHIYIYIYNMPKCLWYSAHAILLRCDPLWFYVIFSIHDDLEGPWETLKSFLSMMPLRHFEGPWKTLRDHERHCFFLTFWRTLRDLEGRWETVRDLERLIFFEGLKDPECPWETVRDLRDREGPERPWGNMRNCLNELFGNLEGTWETVFEK